MMRAPFILMRTKDGCGQRRENSQLNLRDLHGRGIMVSNFVEEFNGLLRLTDEEFQRGKLVYPNLKMHEYYLSMEWRAKNTGITASLLSK